MGDCGCQTAPTPGIYCGCRPVCEGFVDCFLLPFLQSGCGKCLINNIFGPTWRTCDAIIGNDNKDPDRPSGLNAVKAVVVLTIRPVKDLAKYKEVYDKYAKDVQASNAGVRCFFSFVDKSRESTVLQVGWYDSPEVLAAIPTDPAVEACYPETVADGAAFGAVWGNRNDVVKKALASRGVAYEFGSLPRGFMKSAPHSGFDPTLYPGPPIIWMSKRWVMPGRNPNSAYAADRAWQHPLSVLC